MEVVLLFIPIPASQKMSCIEMGTSSVTVNGTTTATIDENTTLTESTGRYYIKGTMTLTGDHVVLSATATPVGSTTETDVRTLSFAGDLNK